MTDKKGSFFDQRDRLLEKKEKWNFACTQCESKQLEFHVLNKVYRPAIQDDYANLPESYQKRLSKLPTIIDLVLSTTQGANLDLQVVCQDCGETENGFYNNTDGRKKNVSPSVAELKKHLKNFYNYHEPLLWDE